MRWKTPGVRTLFALKLTARFNVHGIPIYAHAMQHTIDYQDQEGHPTQLAYQRLIEFLDTQLRHNAHVYPIFSGTH